MVTFPILQCYEVPHIYFTYFQSAIGFRTLGINMGRFCWIFWRSSFPNVNFNEFGKLVHLSWYSHCHLILP